MLKAVKGHSFNTYAKFSEKLTFLPRYASLVICATQLAGGVLLKKATIF